MKTRHLDLLLVFINLVATAAAGEDEPAVQKPGQQALFKSFQETLTGATLVGHFTVLGQQEADLKKESYTIHSVTKLPQEDYWLFQARIQYAGKDLTVPIPLQVKWAGDTPVITLTNFAIPGLGTFSSRVVIYNDKYAGTWTHDKAGGHLFGTIEKDQEGTSKDGQKNTE